MARPKPKFSDYKYLLEGTSYKLDEEHFYINSNITFTCENNHNYVYRLGDIKNNLKNAKDCPHCKREIRYNKQRISYNFFKEYGDKYNFYVLNKQEYYSRESKQGIIFKCKSCNDFEIIIKSLGYFEKTYKKRKIKCKKCEQIEKGIKDKNEFNCLLDRIKYKLEEKKINDKIDYEKIPEKLKYKLNSQNKWILIEYKNTKELCKYQCIDCGNIKKCLPYNLFVGDKRGFGCKSCNIIKIRKRIYTEMKNICKERNLYPIKIENFYETVLDNILLKCNNCGKEFSACWKYKNPRFKCPNCKTKKSKTENDFAEFISNIYDKKIIRNDRIQIKPLEIDIYLPDIQLAFEFCGGIWHSNKYTKDNYRHRDKHIKCEQRGIRLITIFEDEWLENKLICVSRIKNLLYKIKNIIFARKCKIIEIENKIALSFCKEHHIQGKGQTKESYGLSYNNELVSVMTFSKPSISKRGHRYDWELNRFCSKINTNIIGGANKLLKCFEKKHKHEILVTFCDLRWGNGNVYSKLGFELISKTRPNYYYIGAYTKWKRKHRFNFTKQKLKTIFNEQDNNLTEEQIAKKYNLYRIFDCGHLKFQKTI